jgi:hypothetical protein
VSVTRLVETLLGRELSQSIQSSKSITLNLSLREALIVLQIPDLSQHTRTNLTEEIRMAQLRANEDDFSRMD